MSITPDPWTTERIKALVTAAEMVFLPGSVARALAYMLKVYWIDADDGMMPPHVIQTAANALQRKLWKRK